MKKIVCDPHVTLVFYQKISHHTTLRMTMYLVFEKMPFFCCLKYNFMRQLRDLLFASCTVSLGSFPTSTRILCVVGYVRYTTNVHTMGICCVLLEPPINVAYLLQCIAI